MLALCGEASAIGLGELRGQTNLGERLRLEIDLLGAEKLNIDANCFRLLPPAGGSDLPWITKGSFSVRRTVPPVLEIRSEIPLREPIVQLAVQVGCGHEISREYLILASPVGAGAPPLVESRPQRESMPAPPAARPPALRPRPAASSASPEMPPVEAPPRLAPRRSEKRQSAMPDRLLLSNGIEVGEPSLRLATELFSFSERSAGAKEAQREMLRLEFRMLMALQEQALTQMEMAEKLRNMEGALGGLQQRASELAQQIDKGGVAAEPPAPASDSPAAAIPPAPPLADRPAPKVQPVVPESSGLAEWSLYGALLGVLAGLGGWLGWRNYRERRLRQADSEYALLAPELEVDPRRFDERDEPGGVDLPVEPAAMGMPMPVDVELDGGGAAAGLPETPSKAPPAPTDSLMSINATTVDEHFEANPVMELAEIMLSFGRVKGAAQALQEYIDNNPDEALQPWVRLMDVYRMAGMRTEFESVARNLNQHFNVEVQHWEPPAAKPARQDIDFVLDDSPEAAAPPLALAPQSLEDMPRIINLVCELWPAGDVVGYLHQLLRDNRGGKRLGFALPVVEDILFLIELKEISNRIE